MTINRMTGPDCVVMYNLINTHTQGTGTGMGMEIRGRTQDGNGDGSGDGNESSSGNGNGDEDGNGDWNEDGIWEGGREAKARKKPHRSRRRHNMGNGGDLGWKEAKT